MTITRDEIVVEGSNEGVQWRAYGFRYKPGDLRRRSAHRRPAPAPSRLADVVRRPGHLSRKPLVHRLRGAPAPGSEPAVLGLLESNPFPAAPPKYIRARLYRYHFTHFGSPDWWTREERGLYSPCSSA